MTEPVEKRDDWHCGGWEGHKNEQLRYMMKLPLSEKLAWLEDAQRVAQRLSQSQSTPRTGAPDRRESPPDAPDSGSA